MSFLLRLRFIRDFHLKFLFVNLGEKMVEIVAWRESLAIASRHVYCDCDCDGDFNVDNFISKSHFSPGRKFLPESNFH